MIEVLITMTNVITRHATNQALLATLAEPLTQALAAWLSSFPPLTDPSTSEGSLPELPSGARASAQSDSTAIQNTKTKGQPDSITFETAISDSLLKTEMPAKSALTLRLKGRKEPSLLTAKLKNTMPVEAEHPDPSAIGRPTTSVLTSELEGPKATALPTGSLQSTTPIEGDTLDPSASEDPATPPMQGSSSAQRGGAGEWSMGVEEDAQVQLARRFMYHVLLHLPVAVLRARQAFWMEHDVGLPELMQSCLGVAVLQAPEVCGITML